MCCCGPAPTPKAANRDGRTPLWLASINGDAGIIGALLEAGADANEKLPLGRTPLMVAARTGSVEAMTVLLDRGADVNAKETLRGTTPLMWAADEGHAAAVKLLIERGADIKARSNPAPRGRGPALGKSNDPRKAVAAQGAALAAGQRARSRRAQRAGQRTLARRSTGTRRRRRRGAGAGGAGGAGDARRTTRRVAAVRQARPEPTDGGELTPLVYAARANDLESVKVLLDGRRRRQPGDRLRLEPAAGRDAEPLLQARRRTCSSTAPIPTSPTRAAGRRCISRPTTATSRTATIRSARRDMDHLEFIKLLLDKGADVNARVKDSTETRTVFTNQWLDENGATAFLRASQSGDLELMKLLLARGADPKIATVLGVTPLHVAAGIGWVEGITYEWSPEATLEAVKMLLELGLDPNAQADTGRDGAARRRAQGRDRGRPGAGRPRRASSTSATTATPTTAAASSPCTPGSRSTTPTVWSASACSRRSRTRRPALLLRKLMAAQGLPAPPMGRTLESICITEACE